MIYSNTIIWNSEARKRSCFTEIVSNWINAKWQQQAQPNIITELTNVTSDIRLP